MKKIMFNDRYGLTQAVIEGQKTVARRIVGDKLWDRWTDYDDFCNSVSCGPTTPVSRQYHNEFEFFKDNLPYKVGEIVAVAQRYQELDNEWCRNHVGVHPAESPYSSCENMAGWNNKMFVRAEACKHQIRITSVRPERLQDITDEDCLKEGLEWQHGANMFYVNYNRTNNSRELLGDTPREAFASLIDKISGRGTWERNPFVWRVEFKLVK